MVIELDPVEITGYLSFARNDGVVAHERVS